MRCCSLFDCLGGLKDRRRFKPAARGAVR